MNKFCSKPVNNKPLKVNDLFAVYGTLKKGRSNARLIGDRAEFIQNDTIAGVLFSLGGFPGYHETSPDVAQGPVTLEVYKVTDETLGVSLDRLEGFVPGDDDGNTFYTRNIVTTDGGLDVNMYVYNSEPRQFNHIESGNF